MESKGFINAGLAEQIRYNQKDQQYLQQLRGDIADIAQKAFGVEKWLRWKELLEFLSDIIYSSLTTLSGLQTLGEEYVGILQLDSSTNEIPSLKKRILTVLLERSCPLVLHLALLRAERIILSPQSSPLLDVRQKAIALFVLKLVKQSIPIFQRCHTILFYFFGTYYQISKRFTGIRMVHLRNWLANDGFKRAYRILGWLSLIQLATAFCLEAYTFKSKILIPDHLKPLSSNELVSTSDKCSLCLEKRQSTTSTPCGHLFCWQCIAEWVVNKQQCPLCRELFEPSRLMCLQNFI